MQPRMKINKHMDSREETLKQACSLCAIGQDWNKHEGQNKRSPSTRVQDGKQKER